MNLWGVTPRTGQCPDKVMTLTVSTAGTWSPQCPALLRGNEELQHVVPGTTEHDENMFRSISTVFKSHNAPVVETFQ